MAFNLRDTTVGSISFLISSPPQEYKNILLYLLLQFCSLLFLHLIFNPAGIYSRYDMEREASLQVTFFPYSYSQ